MLLDDEEITKAYRYGNNRSVAKAQLKKVVESDKFDYCDSAGDNFTGIGYFISIEDWQSLLEEVKDV